MCAYSPCGLLLRFHVLVVNSVHSKSSVVNTVLEVSNAHSLCYDSRVPTPPVATRRERVRVETTAEIKQAAWADMARNGASALSLRAVARDMGMAPSAIYRYFASRDDLLTALIIDAFGALADTLDATYERVRGAGAPNAGAEFLALAAAYRRWALEHPTEYRLVFSTPVPGYTGTPGTTAAAARATSALERVICDMVEEGSVDVAGMDALLNDELRKQLATWAAMLGDDLPEGAVFAAMLCYIAMHGAINLEMNGHFPQSLSDSEALFTAAMHAVVAQIGKSPG
jgi:AcrR family transcriptional regulator